MRTVNSEELKVQLEAFRGPEGPVGADGKDGVSAMHRWDGTTLTITSASGTSSADLRGASGSDYVLTGADKQEIAGMVELTEDLLRYSEQDLTDEEKAQARENIGAISEDEVPDGLPEGAAANQVLVTDGEGKPKWDNRAFYKEATDIKFAVEETEFSKTTELLRVYMEVAEEYAVFDILNRKLLDGQERKMMVDGVIYNVAEAQHINEEWGYVQTIFYPDIYNAHDTESGISTDAPVYFETYEFEEYTLDVYINDGKTHTAAIWRQTETIHPISEKFLPTTVPVIQSAQVGQTVVVKAVDENGKPTEWEAAQLVFPVKLVASDSGITADCTFAEIYAASKNKPVTLITDDENGDIAQIGYLMTIDQTYGAVFANFIYFMPNAGDVTIGAADWVMIQIKPDDTYSMAMLYHGTP